MVPSSGCQESVCTVCLPCGKEGWSWRVWLAQAPGRMLFLPYKVMFAFGVKVLEQGERLRGATYSEPSLTSGAVIQVRLREGCGKTRGLNPRPHCFSMLEETLRSQHHRCLMLLISDTLPAQEGFHN